MDDVTFQALPSWNSSEGGSLSFKFRTNEKNGLVIYNGGSPMGQVSLESKEDLFMLERKCNLMNKFQSDFLGVELVDGYLHLHLDLGSGGMRMRASNLRLDDSAWHRVEVVRNKQAGTVAVDDAVTEFETPGK